MDREIPKDEIRRRQFKTAARIGVPVILAAGLLWWGVATLSGDSVSRKTLQLSTVDRGDIESSVSAMGKVLPAFEEVINSPIASRVLEVSHRPGDVVEAGTPLLTLDLHASRIEAEKQNDRVRMKRLELERQLAGDNTAIGQIEMQIKVGAMKLRRLEAEYANERYLDSIGSGTADKVREAEFAFRSAALELEQLRRQLNDERASRKAAADVARLEIEIMAKEADIADRTLGDAEIRAPRRGTVTEILDRTGQQISQGQQVAVLADLNNYKVEAEAAESYAGTIVPGSHAQVKIGSQLLDGRVASVAPTSVSGILAFTISLDNDSSSLLRAGNRPEVYVFSGASGNVLRIAHGSFYKGPGNYELYVSDSAGKSLERRTVELGAASPDFIEVVKGLAEGESVCINDISKNSKTLKIK